ncbi:MAG: methyltransferase domain-containing protein [Bacteroidota bacterium]
MDGLGDGIISWRNGIPFYHLKTEEEFRLDPYEDYNQMVVRQLDLHFGHKNYPWQAIDDWLYTMINPVEAKAKILVEVGCGLGRQIATLVNNFDNIQAYGFDYSYQMLRIANDYWCSQKPLNWHSQRGWGEKQCPSLSYAIPKDDEQPRKFLHFGLARASALPLLDHSVDALFSCFLFDRLSQPKKVLKEWFRIIKPGGQLLIISPMNFQNNANWESWYPIDILVDRISGLGFTLQNQNAMEVYEPLDLHGNQIKWKVNGLNFTK